MNEGSKPMTAMAALERLDVRTLAAKAVADCARIAGRASKRSGSKAIDPVRLHAVLSLLMRELDAERQALAERGAVG